MIGARWAALTLAVLFGAQPGRLWAQCSSINRDGQIGETDSGNCIAFDLGTYVSTITWGPLPQDDWSTTAFTCNIPGPGPGGGVGWSTTYANGQPVQVATQTVCVSKIAFVPAADVNFIDGRDLQPWYAYWWLSGMAPMLSPQNYPGGQTLGCSMVCYVPVTACMYGNCASSSACSSGYFCDTGLGCCEPNDGGSSGDSGNSGDDCYSPEIACDDYVYEDYESCASQMCGYDGCCEPYDPIIIDVNGDGYSLTSPADGVMFDMANTGQKTQVSWTSLGSSDAFLALDRNGNGRIDNGSELFSNFAPNAKSGKVLSGFNVLAYYDRPENGGNGDGWIDKNDAIFPKLLLWVDSNHNGVSEPNELFSLPQLGIERISLSYQQSKWTDAYGNQFRYRAQVVRSAGGSGKDPWAYDVFLHTKTKS